MRDFFIKLLGGYKAVIVIVEKRHQGIRTVSTIVTFYPFDQMILRTRLGTVSFKKDMSVNFKEVK